MRQPSLIFGLIIYSLLVDIVRQLVAHLQFYKFNPSVFCLAFGS